MPESLTDPNQEFIYVDYNATTPVCIEAVKAAVTAMEKGWANPSSNHLLGRQARALLDHARAQVADLINARESEILFTSGGTESNNLAIIGAAKANREKGRHIITSSIEHPSVSKVMDALAQQGWDISRVAVDQDGRVIKEEFRQALREDTVLCSIMLANNETGAIQPIRELAQIARSRGVLFHTDASQAVGKIPVDAKELGVHLLTIAGHKLYAPKGTGALFLAKETVIQPILHGAGQEMGLRPGTEPVPQAAALGAACSQAKKLLHQEMARQGKLKEKLLSLLLRSVPELIIHSRNADTLPNTLFIAFPDIPAQEILSRVPSLLCSTGAACHDDSCEPSHVLTAMGISWAIAAGSIRISLGRYTTEKDIEQAGRLILAAVIDIQQEAVRA